MFLFRSNPVYTNNDYVFSALMHFLNSIYFSHGRGGGDDEFDDDKHVSFSCRVVNSLK